jgi:hemolysin III
MKKIRRVRLDVHGDPKPVFRGVIHAIILPFAIAAGVVAIVVAKTPDGMERKWASAIFLLSSVLLYSMSAIYHIFNWSNKVKNIFRRIDHANIFILIAGTNTPLVVSLFPMPLRGYYLFFVWSIALLALCIHVVWISAPKILYVLIYILIGLAPIFFISPLYYFGGTGIIVMILVGGLLYIIGSALYALKKPKLSKKWFGFHEIFHTFVVLGYTCHMIAIYLAILH